MYSVNLWGSHPDEDNDDCWTGSDFDTREEALDCYANPASHFRPCDLRSVTHIELARGTRDNNVDGVVTDKVRRLPKAKRAKRVDDDREWQHEFANQAGMGLGVAAYNDAMGY